MVAGMNSRVAIVQGAKEFRAAVLAPIAYAIATSLHHLHASRVALIGGPRAQQL